MKERPTLATARLVLRPLTVADAPDVQRLAGEREVAATTLNIPHPYELGMAEQWISTHQAAYERGELVNFAIVRRTDNTLIGDIGLRINQQHAHAELGYWIGIPFWGQGYCTEAARAVVQYGFEVLGLHRIHASHMTRNPASGRVMQKIGMTYEGCLRQHVQKWGLFEDIATYGMLQSEDAVQDLLGRVVRAPQRWVSAGWHPPAGLAWPGLCRLRQRALAIHLKAADPDAACRRYRSGVRHGVWHLASRGILGNGLQIGDVTLANVCISIIRSQPLWRR